MKNNLISIIIPIYNVDVYLDKCLDSVTKQTYSNIEILLINDGSSDNSSKICEEWKKKDSRIKVINKENGGVSSARNEGIEIARGEYISFIDPDDYIDSSMYEKMTNKMIENGTDICICNYYNIKDNKAIKNNVKSINKIKQKDILKHILLEDYFGGGVCWNKLMKKSIILEERFDTNLSIAEDLDFLFRVLKNAKSGTFISDALYYHISRKGSLAQNENLISWDQEIEVSKKIMLELENTSLKKYARRRFIRSNVSMISKNIKGKNEKKQLKINQNNIKKIWISYILLKENNYKNKIKCFFAVCCPIVLKYL